MTNPKGTMRPFFANLLAFMRGDINTAEFNARQPYTPAEKRPKPWLDALNAKARTSSRHLSQYSRQRGRHDAFANEWADHKVKYNSKGHATRRDRRAAAREASRA